MQTHGKMVERLLSEAGVRINGTEPWDIQVHDERFFARALKDKSLGLGESCKVGTTGQPWCRFA